jgi:hypothetical protein
MFVVPTLVGSGQIPPEGGTPNASEVGVPTSVGRCYLRVAGSCRILINTALQWGERDGQANSNRFSGFETVTKTAEAVQSLFPVHNTPLTFLYPQNVSK